jgi:hypothetical protein
MITWEGRCKVGAPWNLVLIPIVIPLRADAFFCQNFTCVILLIVPICNLPFFGHVARLFFFQHVALIDMLFSPIWKSAPFNCVLLEAQALVATTGYAGDYKFGSWSRPTPGFLLSIFWVDMIQMIYSSLSKLNPIFAYHIASEQGHRNHIKTHVFRFYHQYTDLIRQLQILKLK